MDFVKGAADGQVDKIIDQAATVAKEKVGQVIGGGAKGQKAGGAKDPKKGENVGDVLSGAIGKAATDAAANKAADQALNFGKSLFN